MRVLLLLLPLYSCQAIIDSTVEAVKPYVLVAAEKQMSLLVGGLISKYDFDKIDKNSDGLASLEEIREYGFWGLATATITGLVAWWRRRKKNGIQSVKEH